jgi:hypothetical protein
MDEQNNNENPSYQIVYVYEVQENLDKLEGHGAYQTVGYVGDETLARQMAHLDPKHPGKVIKRTAISVPDGRYYLLMDSSPIRIDTSIEEAQKATALAKLTPEERAMLGLQ